MAQVVERPLWEREVPGSSPGAPIFFMVSKDFSPGVVNFLHSPSDIEGENTLDGVRTLTSRVVEVPGKFSSLFLSIQAQIPEDSYVLLEVQVRVREKWSPFFKLGMLSAHLQTSFPPQQNAFGYVNTDELQLAVPAHAYRYQVHLSGKATVAQVAACLVKDPFVYNEKFACRLPRKSVCYPVENPISQMAQKTPEKRRICSPTALCMALGRLGIKLPLPEVMAGVHDGFADVYGNWLFNMAYAGTQPGITAYTHRFSSLEELKEFLTPQACVVATIAFEENELPGAPLAHTPGHLVVIEGWKNNQILVADPAAPTADTVRRSYGKTEFAAAWLKRKQGMSYIVRKK